LAKTRILVAVRSLAFQHLIEDLFRNRSEVDIVARITDGSTLARAVRRLLPQLVVVNARLIGSGIRETIEEIKSSNPAAKLIVICSVEGFARDLRRFGADAALAEENVVRRLVPVVGLLSGSHR
jgi:DNA-binding NarL/FixJ family response regulator